ncbi:alpha-amylase family glycosyl hydrolase [Neobacillus sp. SuZ13]|uniref:alpha-amylase family glycosyl hydrolase n=1 Tax=Neobacillus sp. SuZ13 TaxID=3047875 RepID=UPI0024C0ADB9|nr:alpha-amylase family glycosyl hydrolase [Neobacillus sp. SuZ13]WHY68331.1 alpha-amylase family glycosyl hydrolase [Neobacillus sp. SuZ13]
MKKITIILILLLLNSSLSAHAAVEKKERLWQDESVYSIMIDRFNDGNRKNDIDVNAKDPLVYNGGDIQGIIDKLDYIHDMGFTAIRLSPIFDNTKNGYHGFWVKDFYKVDEHFGTMKSFQSLVKEAHKRKMRVIIDFVTNNVAADHPWLSDSGKQDWFHAKHETASGDEKQKELEQDWIDGLPDLNQDNPEVKKYLIDTAKWWINKTDIDGMSLPEVNYVPISFWSDFSTELKKTKKDFFLLGVISKNNPIDMQTYTGAGIDSVVTYQYSEKLRKTFASTDQSFSTLYSDVDKNQQSFLRPNFLDNEYTTRFTSDIVAKKQFPGSRWKTAMLYLYTTPGIPIIYYGTEIALNGGGIPDNRGQMSFRAEKELIDYITKVGELRNQLPSLTRGTMEMLYDQNGMVVYKRVYKGETSIIAINNSSKSQSVTLTNDQIEDGKELRGLLGGDKVTNNDNKYMIILDRDNSEVYVAAEKSGINFPLIAGLVVVYLLFFLFLMKLRKNKR